VPEPHIGSRNPPPAAAISGQPARSSSAAARFSFAGAAVAAAMQRVSRQVDREHRAVLDDAHVHAHRRPLGVDARPLAPLVAQLVDDRVLHLQRAVVGVRDPGAHRVEVDRERRARQQVRRPVDLAGGRVQRFRGFGPRVVDLPQHAAGRPRPQAGAVRGLERARPRRAPRALAHVLGARRADLGGQQVRGAERGEREEVHQPSSTMRSPDGSASVRFRMR
jgi:hypothetical protein